MLSKNIFIKLLFSLLILFGSQVHAHSSYWKAKVYYKDLLPMNIAAQTRDQCDDVLTYKRSLGTEASFEPCKQVPHLHTRIGIPGLPYPVFKPPIQWPVPPICLSCPYFDIEDYLKRINPAQAKKVKDLMYDFNIDGYNEDVINLQQQYNVNEFMNELNIIENINRFK